MKRFFISMAVCLMLLGSGRAGAMSLNVQDGDVGELLRSIARMGNINIILDRTVTGNISLKVDDYGNATETVVFIKISCRHN